MYSADIHLFYVFAKQIEFAIGVPKYFAPVHIRHRAVYGKLNVVAKRCLVRVKLHIERIVFLIEANRLASAHVKIAYRLAKRVARMIWSVYVASAVIELHKAPVPKVKYRAWG